MRTATSLTATSVLAVERGQASIAEAANGWATTLTNTKSQRSARHPSEGGPIFAASSIAECRFGVVRRRNSCSGSIPWLSAHVGDSPTKGERMVRAAGSAAHPHRFGYAPVRTQVKGAIFSPLART